jgi:hypothetical protein
VPNIALHWLSWTPRGIAVAIGREDITRKNQLARWTSIMHGNRDNSTRRLDR